MLRAAILGTGNIAPAYIEGCSRFPEDIRLVACADQIEARAQAFAAKFDLSVLSVEDLLGSDEIDIVINLTVPAAHAGISLRALSSGKHVYSEKPLALSRGDGRAILNAAEASGLRVGCAPDTFLGAGGQTSRRVIDSGVIGEPVAGAAFMAVPGHERWHPNPFFYYQTGGGPMFDMGPYYLTSLVNLLGPMEAVSAMTTRGFTERTAGHPDIQGEMIPVEVDTHFAGTVRFASGAIVTTVMSFDVQAHNLPCIEIYGTEGTLVVPDPNTFGGEVQLHRRGEDGWRPVDPVGMTNVQRGIGVAEMARAISIGTKHAASGELAFHVLDAMEAFEESSRSGAQIRLASRVDRPAHS